MKRIFLLILVGLLSIASQAVAKEGFYVGIFYPNETLSGDAGQDTKSGGGWGFRAGMGFNRYMAIEGHYSKTTHDISGANESFDLKSYAGDLKLNFPLTSLDSAQVMTLEPYIMGGYAHYEASGAGDTVKSDGIQYGFGIELYLFKELSVNAGWTKSSISFDSTPKRDGDVKTVDFGVMYHFI